MDPETWEHDLALVSRPGNDLVQLQLFRDYATNSPLYPAVHEYFRTSQVPLLAIWGENDEIFGPDGSRAFTKDLPGSRVELLPGGHFLLESHLDHVATRIHDFLATATPADTSTGRRTKAARVEIMGRASRRQRSCDRALIAHPVVDRLGPWTGRHAAGDAELHDLFRGVSEPGPHG